MTKRERSITAVESLLAEGLELYGKNRVADAVHRWHEVLVLAPDEPRARDYLDCAGVEPPPASAPTHGVAGEPPSIQPAVFGAVDEVASTTVNREVLVELLKARRYEEALLWLRTELRRRPRDAELGRSVTLLEEHLAARFERELGDLDRALCVQAAPTVLRGLASEHRRLLELVDGRATLRDVLASTDLPAYEARRVLALFVRKALVGLLRSVRPGASPTPVSAPPPESAPPRRGASLGRTWTADAEAADLFKRATEAYLHRDYDAAIALYEQCVAASPDHPSAAHNLARLRGRLGR